ncbi:hypothetical protein HJC23_004895 [Cyclotella cryptica]|uniref:Uncharacterized protein n=1 Tax=Cyclotella cryptica TaxID=29204 RepID=A0ABD3P666_9STRA
MPPATAFHFHPAFPPHRSTFVDFSSSIMTTPTTFWRLAGVSYVQRCGLSWEGGRAFQGMSKTEAQYVTKASSTLRMALKEPAKSKAVAQETFAYNRAHWTDGNMGTKTLVDGLKSVGK